MISSTVSSSPVFFKPRPSGPLAPEAGAPLGKDCEITQPPVLSGRNDKYILQSVSARILPDHPVCKCNRHRLGSVNVMTSQVQSTTGSATKAHFKGLITCGSVWSCPVCASKVSERRRLELVQALNAWQGKGGKVYMLTLTFPHRAGDSLTCLMSLFSEARRKLRNRKPFKGFLARNGVHGSIRALEVTYGVNGWHIHTHELLFCSGLVAPQAVELANDWRKACIDIGLREPNGHGVSIDAADKAGDYVSKWGLDSEMTRSALKKAGNGGSYTPFDLLRVVNGSVDGCRHLDDEPERAMSLFSEYFQVLKGRRQLVWSDGLREILKMENDMTDEELAAAEVADAVSIGQIDADDWRLVCRYEMRGAVLDAAERDGWAGVVALLYDLRRRCRDSG